MKRGASDRVTKVVLTVAILVVVALFAYSYMPKPAGNVIYDSTLVLGWSFSDGYKNDLSKDDVYTAIPVGDTKIVNGGSDSKVVSFDGNGDYLKLQKLNSPLQFPTQSLTVSGRFKTNDFYTITQQASGSIPEKKSEITGSWIAQREVFVLSPDPDGAVTFWVHINGNWYSAPSSSNKIIKGVWEHWAGTYDGNELRLYKNGVLMGSRAVSGKAGTASSGAVASVGDLYIGADGDISDRYFNGQADEIKIFDRALNENEVKALSVSSTQSSVDGSGGSVGAPVCGNGVEEGNEACDSGASNGACPKGCSASCTLNACPSIDGSGGSVGAPVCGNGVKEGNEACDSGASNGACPKGCSASCTLNACPSIDGSGGSVGAPVCGNGQIEAGETCDLGTANNGACPKGCSSACKLNICQQSGSGESVSSKTCGNAVVDAGETCDLGTANNGACPKGCSSACKLNTCQATVATNTGGAGNTNTGGGGQGDSGAGGGSFIRTLSAEDFKTGKLIQAKIGDITRFRVGDNVDQAEIKAISETTATFLVTSIPQIVKLAKGENKKIDVNGDGVYDVLLSVSSVNRAQQQVDFSLKSINEAVPAAPKSVVSGVDDKNKEVNKVSPEGVSGSDGKSPISPAVIVIAVILALAILGALAKFFLSKRKEESQE
ncbi:hypothetical protein FJZ18_04060 [Candidatus Pacearchaeota archaeon]|nr:hypothetical protein [Candidatus Pacearchaeota archaeon]